MQALHDTPHLCFFFVVARFGIKNINIVLGDELQFLLECPAFNVTRKSLIRLVNQKCKQFMAIIRFDKYFWLVNCEDERIMQELASFVHTNFDVYL